jgi:uncharacterized membrane protein YdjX (TVP38/TMEM64 family)
MRMRPENLACAGRPARPDEIAGLHYEAGAAPRCLTVLRLVVGGLAVMILLGGVIGAWTLPTFTLAHLGSALGRIRDLGLVGMVLVGVIQIAIALSGFVPGSLIGLLAGTIYGVATGFSLAALSTMIGALLGFLFARSLLRPLLARVVSGRVLLQHFDAALARDGWRVVFLLRLSPIMPFAATSYALGASSVTIKDYLIGTLASLPALLGYVIIGALTKAGSAAAAHGSGLVQWLLIGGGLAATVFLTLHIGRLAAAAGLVSRASLGNDA